MDEQEEVLLVVGNDTKSKTRVTDVLTRSASNPPVITGTGVRIFASSSPLPSLIDSTPIESKDLSPAESILFKARSWISKNSIRRLLKGKIVFIVCVVTSAVEHEPTKLAFYSWEFSWWHVFGAVLGEHKRKVMFIVDTEGPDLHETKKSRIRSVVDWHGFDKSKITYVDLGGADPQVKAVIEDSIVCGKAGENRRLLESFRIKEVWSIDGEFGPWSPERVILFGRTGSGKSTLAQMLTLGKLEPGSKEFASSSGIRGGTKEVERGEGRGWYIVDTPGFGELKDEHSTVPTNKAEKKIKRFVKMSEGMFAHFIFVVKKDRIDELDVRLWKFFALLFEGDGILPEKISVVISNADRNWVNKNMEHLERSFEGCTSFLSAEFPPVKTDDETWEQELQAVRMESLQELEDDLAQLGRFEEFCDFGKAATETWRIAGRSVDLDPLWRSSILRRMRGKATISAGRVAAALERLRGEDGGITLLPM